MNWRRLLSLEGIVAMLTVLFVAAYLLPASIWYEVRLVAVEQPVYEGAEIHLIVDRTIHRSFEGEFEVTVRDASSNTIICNGDGGLRYIAGAKLPDPDRLTLDWWANAPCGFLAAGSYVLETTWWVEWSPIEALDKIVIYDTAFTVLEAPKLQIQQQQLEEAVRGLQLQLEDLKAGE